MYNFELMMLVSRDRHESWFVVRSQAHSQDFFLGGAGESEEGHDITP